MQHCSPWLPRAVVSHRPGRMPGSACDGDADAVRTAHAEQFFEILGGGKKDGGWDGSGISNARLAILPGLTHYDIFKSPTPVSTVASFLGSPLQTAK
jgi:hypothetical protein